MMSWVVKHGGDFVSWDLRTTNSCRKIPTHTGTDRTDHQNMKERRGKIGKQLK